MSHKPKTHAVSSRTELRTALARLDATRAQIDPLVELREWRSKAARRYVRPSSARLSKAQP